MTRAARGRLRHHPQAAALVAASAEALSLALATRLDERPLLRSGRQLVDHLRFAMGYLDDEELRVLFLDVRFRLLADEILAQGTIDRVNFDVRRIVHRALELNATALIVAHNHPSGATEPSEADRYATRLLAEGAKVMRIELLDHLIFGPEGFTSFRDRGLL